MIGSIITILGIVFVSGQLLPIDIKYELERKYYYYIYTLLYNHSICVSATLSDHAMHSCFIHHLKLLNMNESIVYLFLFFFIECLSEYCDTRIFHIYILDFINANRAECVIHQFIHVSQREHTTVNTCI